MKHILIILSFLLLSSPLFGQSVETCYVDADTSKEFDPTLLSDMSVSLISEFLKEVEPLPPAGIPMDACVYQIGAVKVKEKTFVTFKGKNLNSFGDSKLSGPDGFQEAVLKALYRALEDKRKLICDAYGEYIGKCGGAVKKIPADKIGKIREMQSEYDLLGKRIAGLDTRIEKLNNGAIKVVPNPHSLASIASSAAGCFLDSVDYLTSDYVLTHGVVSALVCQARCKDNPRCKYFTFYGLEKVGAGKLDCYEIHETTPLDVYESVAGAISGPKACATD